MCIINTVITTQLPSPICSYQELNYTIIVDDVNGSTVSELGPFYHLGPGSVKHEITSGLVRDEEYSVGIRVATPFHVVTSYNHFFGKETNDSIATFFIVPTA